MKLYIILLPALVLCTPVYAQPDAQPKGRLFIIGGGDRPPSLMQSLVNTAALAENDYVVVLPMSSGYPDTSYHYFKADLEPLCNNAIVNFNFTPGKLNDRNWLDSLQKAKLIFITGGDQDRFMKAVQNTAVYSAIHQAYINGATIAGTSAGAAVMSRHMITGHELRDTVYRSTFNKLRDNNIEFKEGLGLLTLAIIDQHFVARSRYNRLLSAIAHFPRLTCIGIDEETAIVVQGSRATVVGNRQVVVMKKPVALKVAENGLLKLKDLQFSIYTAGDDFDL